MLSLATFFFVNFGQKSMGFVCCTDCNSVDGDEGRFELLGTVPLGMSRCLVARSTDFCGLHTID